MLNTREIILSTFLNQFIIFNLDNGISTIYSSVAPIIAMKKYNFSVYGVDNYNNFYKQLCRHLLVPTRKYF